MNEKQSVFLLYFTENLLLVSGILSLHLYCFILIVLCSGSVVPMLLAVMAVVPIEKLAVHFHDTYGQSLPNILVSLQVSPQLNCLVGPFTC